MNPTQNLYSEITKFNCLISFLKAQPFPNFKEIHSQRLRILADWHWQTTTQTEENNLLGGTVREHKLRCNVGLNLNGLLRPRGVANEFATNTMMLCSGSRKIRFTGVGMGDARGRGAPGPKYLANLFSPCNLDSAVFTHNCTKCTRSCDFQIKHYNFSGKIA